MSGEASVARPLDPTARERWRRWRFPIAMGAALVVVATIITALQGGGRGFLDPDGVNASGARALVRLLEDQGVEVTPVETLQDAVAAATGTVLVTEPDRLVHEQFDQLVETGADIVLVAPGGVENLAPGYRLSGETFDEVAQPECDLPVASRAGAARLGGRQYAGPDEAATCYAGSLVVGPMDGGGRLALLGTHAPLVNRYLDQDGNAALAMGLLGQHAQLAWYRPGYQQPPGAQRGLTELLPDWVMPAAWQLVIAVGFAAWWRARRLGPVVVEPLPVVVRAAEATEGRARLYRRGRAREHAAAILRDAATRRLRNRLGVPPGAPVIAVVDAVSVRSSKDPTQVAAILTGDAPTDDAGLVRLADSLDALEQEVR